MPIRLVTPPASEPVTLAEAKAHLRLEVALDDSYVNDLIKGARQYIEKVCWRGLMTQTWELVLPGFVGEDRFDLPRHGRAAPPAGSDSSGRFTDYIELPRGNVGTLLSDAVKYIDRDGVQQTLAPSVYTVDDVSEPGRLRLAYGQLWPTPRAQWDAVRIRYPVGWALATDVPLPLKQSVLILIAQMYEFRTLEVTSAIIAKVGFSVDALTDLYRLVRLF